MKKWITCALLVLGLSVLMSTAAFAAEEEGIKDVSMTASGITATVDASNRDILDLSYTGAASGSEYVVFVTKDSATPSQSNLVYIDQKTGGQGFKIYPMSLTSGSTYHVWLSSNASSGIGSNQVEKVGTFGYYSTKPAVTLGDVDGNGKVNSVDALYVLRNFAGNYTFTADQTYAADVDGNSRVNSVDALYIVRLFTGNITKFPAES